MIYLSSSLNLSTAIEGGLPKHFSGLAYSGAPIDEGYGVPFVVDMSTTTVSDSLPLMDQHDHSSIIGSINSAVNDGRSLSIAGDLFSDIDEKAKSIAMKSQRGAPYQMSIGLFGSSDKLIKDGETAQVNGIALQGPICILSNGQIREVSIVALGADRNTNARFFSSLNKHEESVMSDTQKLTAQIAELTEKLRKTEAEMLEYKNSIQLAAIKSAFSAVGQECDEKRAAPYMALSQEALSSVLADLVSMKIKPPAHLFKEQATGDLDIAPHIALSASKIYAERNKARGGV